MKRTTKPSRRRLRQRTQALRRAISELDFVASGTVHTRMKLCGNKSCRCAVDPAARHGPYHQWSRRQDGRLIHKILTPEQAELVGEAINNYRQIKELLARWQRETAAEILNPGAEDND